MNSRRILTTAAVALVASVAVFAPCAQVSFGTSAKFNEGWLFTLDAGADSAAMLVEYADTAWREVCLPHDWSVEHPMSPSLASCTGYLPGGIGWYRKHFEVTDTAKLHYIYFEGVYNRSDVYVNGSHVGNRPNGYSSFMYDITPYLTEGDNVMAVRVDHSRYADSRWYTGSGIYRDVYIVSAPDTHIAQWGVGYKATKVGKTSAVLDVDVAVVGNTDGMNLQVEIVNDKGAVVSRTNRKKVSEENVVKMTVTKPRLWDVDDPYLYTLRVSLMSGGKIVDSTDVPMGIRTIRFDADKGFELNGRNMKIKGVCIHHDAGTLGAVVPPQVWERRLKKLKELGVNAIRMSHNPQAPAVYDLCDRLGLMVMDEASDEWEFPKRKWVEGWNVGKPSFDGSYDFFDEWIDRDVADMVRRDRCHPSIILWSIGNEVDYPNDPYSHPILDSIPDGAGMTQPMYGGYKPEAPSAERIGHIAGRLAGVVRGIDDSRPVTGALAGVVMSNCTSYPENVDVVGYNYTEKRYDEDHATYPTRVIYGSENRSDYAAWQAVVSRPFISGQFIWTGIDYLGESGRWPSRGLYTGLIDFAGNVKPRGYFRASLWSDTPTTYIGTYPLRAPRNSHRGAMPPRQWLSIDAPDTWNYNPGQPIRVVCYTNAPQARLLLDGTEVGAPQPYDSATGIIYWDIPYVPGTLTAQGMDMDGNVMSTYTIYTTGTPYALRAKSDIEGLDQSNPIAHIDVEVLDSEGRVVDLADNMIHCHVEGPARLLALESGSNTDTTPATSTMRRVYRGRLLAYIQYLGDSKEPVRVIFKSPLLQGATIEL